MADQYDIYIRGFAPGAEAPEHALHRVFGIDHARACELVLSLPRVVKRRLTAEQVVRYELALRHVRADYELRVSPLRPSRTEVIGGAHTESGDGEQQHGSTLTLPPPAEHALPAVAAGSARTRAGGDLPPPWEVPGLNLSARPDWVVDGPSAYAPDVLGAPAPEVQARTSASRAHGRTSISGTAPALRGGASMSTDEQVYRVGTVHGAEPPPSLRTRIVRAALSIGVVLSLAMVGLAAARHYGLLDRTALARLGTPTSALDEPTLPADPLTPVAREWAQSDLHQFSNGDKERVRALIERFEHAGAREVRAGHITPSGQLQIAAELVVVLPRDVLERKAVFAEYERFLRSAFGDFVAAPKDDGTELLHVAL